MGSILSPKVSIVSVHGPPQLYFEPLNLLNFDINADMDLAFYTDANPDPAEKKKNSDPSGSATLIFRYIYFSVE
jgi:hypothetical protein